MRRHLLWLAGGALLAGGSIIGTAACSGDSAAPEGGLDASFDSTSGADAGHDAAPLADAGHDAATPKVDAGGHCSAVTGACDIVAQDCDGASECFEVPGDGGIWTTACIPTTGNSRIAKGAPCCPGQQSNPCLPGLECLGDLCQGDAAPSARCAPRCCSGNAAVCGSSPEGFPGVCDTDVTGPLPDGGVQDLFFICSYSEVCRPLGLAPCPTGFGCLVSDNQGSAKCVQIYDPNGPADGLGEGAACTYANQCADGLMCLGPKGAQATCRMLCLTPGSMPPFDAGALADGPGTGGCAAGKTCSAPLDPTQFPAWLSLCK
jgi:hypothetical protein